MSSNSKMMRISHGSQMESSGSTITKSLQPISSNAGSSSNIRLSRPEQPEKRTFEQAYRDAVERLNAAAMSRSGSKQRQNTYPKQPVTGKPGITNKIIYQSSEQMHSVSSVSAPSQNQYKTTIYNINTINLAELLKSQHNVTNVGRSGGNIAPISISSGSLQNALLSQNAVARVMAESTNYRQTFSNAYANHLLELTKNAVEKKTAKPLPSRPSVGDSVIPINIKPTSGHPVTKSSPKKHRKLVNPIVLNGKDYDTPTYAEVVSSNRGNKNGNMLIKLGRTEPDEIKYLNRIPSSFSDSSLINLQRTTSETPFSLDKKINDIRLKPSHVQVGQQEIYKRLQSQTKQNAQKQTVLTNPAQQRSNARAPPVQTSTMSPCSSLPLPEIGNRPDLTVIMNKPRISSPAPLHVYGKPTISTSGTSSTGHVVVSVGRKTFKDELNVSKPNQFDTRTPFTEPPPAHSPFRGKLTTSPPPLVTPTSSPIRDPKACSSSDTRNISIKTSGIIPADGVLNLDTKAISVSPISCINITSTNNTLHTSNNEHTLQYSFRSGESLSNCNGQKVVKIEKRVNYGSSASKSMISDTTLSKYQHNVVWKEQPVKQEIPQPGNGCINEQKKKLLELLHNANMQQLFSQAQAHAHMQVKDTQTQSKAAITNNAAKTALTMQMNHMNKINMELYKYRIKNLSSANSNISRLPDPLMIKTGPHKPIKRRNPPNRANAIKRKRPRLARSTDPYLQNGPCYQVAPRLSRCRECGRSAAARSRDAANIFCRFIAFRKLRYNEIGQMEAVGFANPDIDPQNPDTGLWNANLEKVPIDMSVEKSKFLLGQVGYKFCELFHQEKEAYFEHMSEDKTIAWKQAVQGVRELCDVCSTTLFNYHWVCSTCGFVVCIDCYKGRKHGYCKNETGTRDRDGYMWLNCTNREPHVQEKLMLTQIIPSNCLYKLVRQMHGICALLEIPLNCECPLSKESLFRKIKDRLEFIYPIIVEHSRKEEETSTRDENNTDLIAIISTANETTTKMISITVKNIESRISETDSGTVCCKVIFGRELSADKNPATEILKRREKQSYCFDGFQEDIKIESLDDFIEGRRTPIIDNKFNENVPDCSDVQPSLETTNAGKPTNNAEIIENGNDMQSTIVETDGDAKSKDKDPLELISEGNTENTNLDADKKTSVKAFDSQDDAPYNEEHRLKPSPKLDWKTFNMIVKQLLKFDKSINISGLFEKHLTEKCPESESLVDFTAEIEVNHTNIQSFLHDFLDQFVFLTGPAGIDNLADDVQILEYNKYIKNCVEFQNKGERVIDLEESLKLYPNVEHQWLCNGRLLRLLDPLNDDNYTTFHDQWERGQPVMVSYVSNKMDMNLWLPQSFGEEFGEDENDLINCLNGKLVKGQKMKLFWDGFDKIGLRLLDERDRPMLLKLKDWPPGDDFAEMMPSRFDDLMKCLPLAEYTRREGRLNLASRLCSFFVRPDLGPKMYSAYGSALHPSKGTTNLHLDVSDAVNVMVYVSVPKDVDQSKYIQKVYDAIDRDECDVFTRQRIREKDELPGALWHIYHAKDADKIRSLLNKIEVERGGSIKANHDPIHDQKWYLDANLRKRLLQEYNVEGYSIVQCSGDAIFIPAGAPHQVRNLHNCIKVAEDFVSPENISYCFKLTNEFRHLTNTHSNHEDKLQIKNIIYHTVKDAVSCLANPLIMTKDKIDLL
ncbi:uncharacterized protein LOC131427559 isoform X2 [Malaya genurostris]|uniref:uncharacterized protein LOC131427559 isoform X2 n=1 Tax=Malaya genurostris TaxID=325434 RepID=UPI0026F3882D|nr:uncharacterized protein LOC131427559 isoform X2 [Malaya genurostris]